MFGRHIFMKLKMDSAGELSRINEDEIIPILRKQKGFLDETLFIAAERSEALANSLWETKEDAEAYSRTAYAEELKILSNVAVGTPIVETFEFVSSALKSAALKKRN